MDFSTLESSNLVATVLTVYSIETFNLSLASFIRRVATVLTVYGIETLHFQQDLERLHSCNSTYRLRY